MTWTRGQRIPVADLGVSDDLALGLGTTPAGFEVVVAGLGDDERLVDRGFLLSRHQPASFEGSVTLAPGSGGDAALVTVRLARVPSSVESLRLAIVGDVTRSADDLDQAWVRLLVGGAETARWSFGGDELSGERAIIIADLYRRDGWRLHLQGTGYRAGLAAFLERIGGGSRLPGAPEATPPPAAPPSAPGAPFPPSAPGAPFPPPAGVAPPAPSAPSAPAPPHPPPPAAPPAPPVPVAPPAPAHPGSRPTGGTRRQKPLRRGLSRTERLFSRPVGRALVSPSGLGAAAGGAVVGGGLVAVATGSLGIGLLSGAAAGTVAWLGRGAAAMPGTRGEKVDPYALREPWRGFVVDAVGARDTFSLLVLRTPEGPLGDRLGEIAARVEDGLQECWRIASRGDAMREARIAIDDTAVRAEIASLQAPGSSSDPDTRARLSAALQSQIDTAARLDRLLDSTYDELRLLDARLDDVVARAIEISATATDTAAFGRVGADVDGLVEDLEALRQGLEEVRGIDRAAGAGPGVATPGTA